VPGSPRFQAFHEPSRRFARLHPAALLIASTAVGAGVSLARSWWVLAAAALALLVLARAVEHRPFRAELPLLGLAAVVFAAHAAAAGAGWRAALAPSASIAFRLLALVCLVRWSVRAYLGRASRWLLGLTPPARPRVLAALLESGRLVLSLLPLAIREAEQHALALRARGMRPGRGVAGRSRFLAAWFLPFLGTMLRSGDAFADALQTRGYAPGAPRRGGLQAAWGIADWSLVGAAGLLAWGITRGA
jgi:energy-coupling factor transporter transmembrane protein EcfT